MIESGYEPIPTTQGYLREIRLGTNVYVVTNTNKVQIIHRTFKTRDVLTTAKYC